MRKTKFTDVTHTIKSAGPTRRKFLIGAGAVATAAATPLILTPGKARAAGDQIVVATWGGRFAEALTEVYYKPFEEATGIKVVVTGAPDFAKLTAAVKTGSVDIDIADLASGWVVKGEETDVWAPIDNNIVNTEGVIPAAVRDKVLAYYTYAGGMGWSQERNGEEGKHPTTWPEFWDTEKIPGRRGVRTRISETLEIALMADGVDPKEVYPCDVERGFKALDRLKDNLQFIAQTPKTIERIAQDECDFTYTYNGRAYGANQAGIPIGFSFKQNFFGLGWVAAVNKSPNPEGAQKLLAYLFDAKRQAEFGNTITYPGTLPASMAMVSEEAKPWLPDPTAHDACIENLDWWAPRFEELTKRYKEWQLT
jgi:putative spermidine/putrescine transport system substrate-binding protein